ncbi:AAA family ATPase [Sphingomonas sp. LR61]|uniref:AAA family ATPase n=1 Tax=Sphingomonas sp. LR61 TaxID=3050234 RepID=UPI002FDF967E
MRDRILAIRLQGCRGVLLAGRVRRGSDHPSTPPGTAPSAPFARRRSPPHGPGTRSAPRRRAGRSRRGRSHARPPAGLGRCRARRHRLETTALKVAARAIEAEGGRMIGLTPSAAAAAVMSDAVGIRAVTLDKFLVGTTLERLLEGKSITGDIDLLRWGRDRGRRSRHGRHW